MWERPEITSEALQKKALTRVSSTQRYEWFAVVEGLDLRIVQSGTTTTLLSLDKTVVASGHVSKVEEIFKRFKIASIAEKLKG